MAVINDVGNALTGLTGTGTFVGSTSPTLTTPRIGTISDTNGLAIVALAPAATAVNNIQIANAATGGAVPLNAIGTDTDVGLNIVAKGNAAVSIFGASGGTQPFNIFNGTTLQHSTIMTFANTAAARTVTWPDASGTVQFVAGSGGLKSIQVFTSGTAATYTTPAGITSIVVECVGGGGAGGGMNVTTITSSAGGGGGGGGYCLGYFNPASASYTYTVGLGGTAGTAGANPGNAGTATTFSTMSAGAGGGGGGGTASATPNIPLGTQGAAGTSSGGIVNLNGQIGSRGLSQGIIIGGAGGWSGKFFGPGGNFNYVSTATSLAGSGGAQYGGGGAGAAGSAVNANQQGGVGGVGIIIVWEYA